MSIIPGIDSRAPRAHRDQQRIIGVAEALTSALLQARERLVDCVAEAVRGDCGSPRMYSTHASVVIVNPAGTRSGPSTRVISAMSGALAAEQLAHVARALGEVVNPLAGGPNRRSDRINNHRFRHSSS